MQVIPRCQGECLSWYGRLDALLKLIIREERLGLVGFLSLVTLKPHLLKRNGGKAL